MARFRTDASDPTRTSDVPPNILLSTGPDVFQVSRLASYTASVEPADAVIEYGFQQSLTFSSDVQRTNIGFGETP